MTSVLSISLSEQLLPLVNAAWDEVKDDVQPPTDGTITKFDPSTTCKVIIDWVHSEVTSGDKPTKPLYSNSWGFAYFPKLAIIGKGEGDTPWAIIPIHIVGTVKIGAEIIRCGAYYKIPRRSLLEVSEYGRLTGLVLWS